MKSTLSWYKLRCTGIVYYDRYFVNTKYVNVTILWAYQKSLSFQNLLTNLTLVWLSCICKLVVAPTN